VNVMFAKIAYYFSYDFVRAAMIVGVLVSVCAALFGVVLVLKRFSFIGDGLSHVTFGAMALAAVAGISDNTLVVMPVTVITAVLLLGVGKNAKVGGPFLTLGFNVVYALQLQLFGNIRRHLRSDGLTSLVFGNHVPHGVAGAAVDGQRMPAAHAAAANYCYRSHLVFHVLSPNLKCCLGKILFQDKNHYPLT